MSEEDNEWTIANSHRFVRFVPICPYRGLKSRATNKCADRFACYLARPTHKSIGCSYLHAALIQLPIFEAFGWDLRTGHLRASSRTSIPTASGMMKSQSPDGTGAVSKIMLPHAV